jgi:hypothetical protein
LRVPPPPTSSHCPLGGCGGGPAAAALPAQSRTSASRTPTPAILCSVHRDGQMRTDATPTQKWRVVRVVSGPQTRIMPFKHSPRPPQPVRDSQPWRQMRPRPSSTNGHVLLSREAPGPRANLGPRGLAAVPRVLGAVQPQQPLAPGRQPPEKEKAAAAQAERCPLRASWARAGPSLATAAKPQKIRGVGTWPEPPRSRLLQGWPSRMLLLRQSVLGVLA